MKVQLKLKDGKELRGTLRGFDQQMKLVVEDAEELVTKNGVIKVLKVGTVIISGEEVLLIHPPRSNIKKQ